MKPMTITALPDLPTGVLGFRASGVVEASDYESVLDPALDATIDSGDKINLVYVLGDDLERYSLGALWQDGKLEGKPSRVWGRIALVTNHSVIGEAIHLVSFAFPCDLKLFRLDEEDAAIKWAAKGAKKF